MVNYVGKVCPFCKTEIKDGDNVKTCEACGIPHHQECWDENKGCSTFGCSEQHYEPQGTNITDVCANCGTALGDGQAFCPKCGAPKKVPQSNICGKCGAELNEGQEFCPRCGQKAGLGVDASAANAINQFNNSVKNKKNKTKFFPIILVVVLLIVGTGGFFVYSTIQKNNAAKAHETYISDTKAFATLTLSAGVNLEDIADTVEKYWSEFIYDDRHGSSIDSAIMYALDDKYDEITKAKSDDTRVKAAYDKIKKLPEGVEDSDLAEIRDAAKDLFNIYTEYYDFATSPSGSYTSFSEQNSSKTDDFVSKSRALSNLLD